MKLSGGPFNLSSERNPFEEVTLREKIMVQVDSESNLIQCNDGLNKGRVNAFWNQLKGPTVNKERIAAKEIEDIELSPKLTVNQSEGMKL